MKTALKNFLTFRSLVATALLIWSAGAGCIMVSYARGAMSAAESAAPTAEPMLATSSAAMDSHACCKARHQALERTHAAKKSTNIQFGEFALFPPTRGDAMSCCPLTTGSIVVASRSQSNETGSAAEPTDSSSFKLENTYETPLVVPLRLANRAHSYLLDCAFLI